MTVATATPTRRARPVIVAVDDDPAVLNSVRGDLRTRYGRDYRIIVADSGKAAIDLLRDLKVRDEPVALVISDQRMPQVSGFEVLEAAKGLFADLRTVLLTAYADTEVAIGAINRLRLDYYILKPWDPPGERLYPVVDDLLGDWHASHRPSDQVTRVVGTRHSAEAHALRDFLQRNQIPMLWLDADTSDEAQRLLAAAAGPLPLVITPDGTRLDAPDVAALAGALGHKTTTETAVFDLAIVGAGPAGLAASVYGASEGLSTVCIERTSPGGQAGQSSRIENYLGFPTGIAGADLARRAVTQARRFDVEVLTPASVRSLDLSGPYPRLELGDGSSVTSGALVLACGVEYNTIDVPGAAEFDGRGVYYGAALSERDTVAGESIVVVGGANSAGQAAVYFSDYAKRVTVICRSASIGAKMSTYLVDQIAARDNIDVRCGATVQRVLGDGRVEAVLIAESETDTTEELPTSSIFVFIGASPHTSWLPAQIATDDRGFILTGPALGPRRYPAQGGTERDPFLYETSVPGVFAVGDVRARSIKRVASAVGEGSVTVQMVHQYLGS